MTTKIESSAKPQANAAHTSNDQHSISTISRAEKAERQLAREFLEEFTILYLKHHNIKCDVEDFRIRDVVLRYAREGNFTEREAVLDILRMRDEAIRIKKSRTWMGRNWRWFWQPKKAAVSSSGLGQERSYQI